MRFSIQIIMSRRSPDESMREVAHSALELAKMADRAGFDIVFTAEHHGLENAIAPNPFTILAAWGQHLEHARLGTAVVVAPYWHPIRLAGEAAMTDVLTDGRLELGIGRGAYQYEFDRLAGGLAEHEGGRYLREAIPAIRKLWAGDYSMETELWKFPNTTSVPKPQQQGGIPFWIAARSPETFDYAVQNDCHIMCNPLSLPIEEIYRLRALYDSSVANHGNPGFKPRFMLTRPVCLFTSDEHRRIAVETVQREVRLFTTLFRNIGSVENGFPEEAPAEAVRSARSLDPDAIVESNLMGSPERVVDELKAYAEAGVEEYLYPVSPGLPHEVSVSSLRMFIDEVMPAL
jgi:flavin-dependent trigonelline monooxygenase, oxygenase component